MAEHLRVGRGEKYSSLTSTKDTALDELAQKKLKAEAFLKMKANEAATLALEVKKIGLEAKVALSGLGAEAVNTIQKAIENKKAEGIKAQQEIREKIEDRIGRWKSRFEALNEKVKTHEKLVSDYEQVVESLENLVDEYKKRRGFFGWVMRKHTSDIKKLKASAKESKLNARKSNEFLKKTTKQRDFLEEKASRWETLLEDLELAPAKKSITLNTPTPKDESTETPITHISPIKTLHTSETARDPVVNTTTQKPTATTIPTPTPSEKAEVPPAAQEFNSQNNENRSDYKIEKVDLDVYANTVTDVVQSFLQDNKVLVKGSVNSTMRIDTPTQKETLRIFIKKTVDKLSANNARLTEFQVSNILVNEIWKKYFYNRLMLTERQTNDFKTLLDTRLAQVSKERTPVGEHLYGAYARRAGEALIHALQHGKPTFTKLPGKEGEELRMVDVAGFIDNLKKTDNFIEIAESFISKRAELLNRGLKIEEIADELITFVLFHYLPQKGIRIENAETFRHKALGSFKTLSKEITEDKKSLGDLLAEAGDWQ